MENTTITKLMQLIAPLSIESKLELLSKLSANLKVAFHTKENNKEQLLNELPGAWSDTEENLAEEILKTRT